MGAEQLSSKDSNGITLGQSPTDLISFYNVTPIVQPSGDTQGIVTDNTGGTPEGAIGQTIARSLLTIPAGLADLTTSGLNTAIVMPFAGKVLGVSYYVTVPSSTAAKAATATLNVNGAPATGGVVALTTANTNTANDVVVGTTVTAGNTFTAGQTIGLAISAVTTFVEGKGFFAITVQNEDMLDAISTFIAGDTAVKSALVALGLIKGSA